MSDQEQQHSADQTHGLPALLPVNNPLQTTDVQRIIEDQTGKFEADLVLCPVALVLVAVSFNPHRTAPYCLYIIVNTFM